MPTTISCSKYIPEYTLGGEDRIIISGNSLNTIIVSLLEGRLIVKDFGIPYPEGGILVDVTLKRLSSLSCRHVNTTTICGTVGIAKSGSRILCEGVIDRSHGEHGCFKDGKLTVDWGKRAWERSHPGREYKTPTIIRVSGISLSELLIDGLGTDCNVIVRGSVSEVTSDLDLSVRGIIRQATAGDCIRSSQTPVPAGRQGSTTI